MGQPACGRYGYLLEPCWHCLLHGERGSKAIGSIGVISASER